MLTRLTTSRARTLAALVFILSAVPAPPHASAFARGAGQDEERRRAFELFEEQKYFEALPLLEKSAARYPQDGDVHARLGFALFARSITEQDAAKRQGLRARARAALVRGKELGFDEGVPKDLVEQILASMNPDGSDAAASTSRFSANAEADAAMRTGEAAFVKGDLDAALAAYERALRLDPRLYEAPLFAGDVLLRKGDFVRAGEWYARAIQLDPDREQAHRYWGNVLMRQARLDEARDKYVEAIVAEPYNPYVWEQGLFRWAQARALRLGHPEIAPPPGPAAADAEQKRVTVTTSRAGPWSQYALTRSAWEANDREKFKKEYPGEKEYRHSLREEAEALRAVAEAARRETKEGRGAKLDPALHQLVKLDDDGLLEAYVLFARVRQVNSVAADYVAYRKEHRDKLRRYLIEYVASGKY
ncbi:MAG: tetratricopeptide repeat protein [Acidobacteriota bacterium]|nr:tetratricopeptide repeat protein [Acidobacteriota bacterium]